MEDLQNINFFSQSIQTEELKRGRGRPKKENKLTTKEYARKKYETKHENCLITGRVYYYRTTYPELMTEDEIKKYRSVIDEYAKIKIALKSIKEKNINLFTEIIDTLYSNLNEIKINNNWEIEDEISDASTQ